MRQERGITYALKMLLVGLLPFVIGVVVIFYLHATHVQKPYIIDRNYRVLATASHQLQGRFAAQTIAFQWFIKSEKQCPQNLLLQEPSLKKKEDTLFLFDQSDPDCRMSMPTLVEPLQDLKFFDNVILVDRTGTSIYYQWERQRTAPVVDFQSLLASTQPTTEPRPESTDGQNNQESGQTLSNPTKLKEAFREPILVSHLGIKYRLFLIPISFDQNLPNLPPDVKVKKIDLLLAGLVREQRFMNEIRRLSPILLVGISSILIMAVLVWPLLTLLYLRPSERLRGRDIRVLVVSSLLAVSLLTFVVLYVHTDLKNRAFFDHEMQTLGEHIKTKFQKELTEMFNPLKKFKEIIEKECSKDSCLDDDGKPKDETIVNITKELNKTLGTDSQKCPKDSCLDDDGKPKDKVDFHKLASFLWINEEGKGLKRWTVKASENDKKKWELEPSWTPRRDFKDRSYFINAQAGQLWNFHLPQDQSLKDFVPEVIQSRFTGDTIVIMAVPLSLSTEIQRKPHVAVVTSKFPSLTQATLLPGMGFAVIEDAGKVLLHSDARKNLWENILHECDNTAPLQSAMFARRAQYIDTHYYGRWYRFYVQPIRGTPWFLIVFHERGIKSRFSRANLTLFLGWFMLFSPYMGLWILAFFVLQLLHNRLEWLWPDHRRMKEYWEATAMIVITSIACFAIVWKAHALSRFVMCWIVLPSLLFSLLYCKLGWREPGSSIYLSHKKYIANIIVVLANLIVLLLVGDRLYNTVYISTHSNFFTSLDVYEKLSIFSSLVVMIISIRIVLRKYSETPGIFTTTKYKDRNHEDRLKRALRRAYGVMLFSLLITIVIIPAVLVFWDIHQQTMEAFMKQSQLDYAELLEEHTEERIEDLRQTRERRHQSIWPWMEDELRREKYKYGYPSAFTDGGLWKKEVKAVSSSVWGSLLCGQEWSPTCQEELELLSRHVSAVVLQLLPASPWLGERFGVMTYNQASDDAWKWELQDAGRTIIFEDLRDKNKDKNKDKVLYTLIGAIPRNSIFTNPLLLSASLSEDKDKVLYTLIGAIPRNSIFTNPLLSIVSFLAVLALAVLIYKLLLLAAQRIFLMDYGGNDIPYATPNTGALGNVAPSTASKSSGTLWISIKSAGQNFQGLLLSSSNVKAHAQVIDLLRIAAPSALPSYMIWQATGRLIIVDRLEGRLHEREWSVALLAWLEALAFRYDGPVVILSAIDSLYSLSERLSEAKANNALTKSAVQIETQPQGSSGDGRISAAEELERWARVFTQFSTVLRPIDSRRLEQIRLKEAESKDAESKLIPFLAKEIIPEMYKQVEQQHDVMEARFWTTWLQCTRREKLALRQFAEEGFVNPEPREVLCSLGHRQLIYRDPALQMREPFRKFVCRAESRQTIAQWEGETEANWLSRLQMPLLLGLIIVATFFVSTQRDLATTMLTLMGAFTATLPRIVQLFGVLTGQRGEGHTGGNTGA
jgi:hypothetical protein